MAHANASWQQEAFRIRNDDGSETAASWKFGLNVDGNVTMDQIIRVRFLIDETNNVGETEGFQIQYEINAGGYANVGAATACQFANSGNVVNGAATTQQISTGAFTAGETCEDGITNTDVIAANDYIEHEFVLLLDSGQLTDGDVVRLRIIEDGGAVFGSYLQYPDLTARFPVWEQQEFRIRNDDGNETVASWKYGLNTDGDINVDEIFRVRLTIVNSVTDATEGFSLQANVNGGGWNTITGSSACQFANSTNITNLEDTTQQIGGGTFVTGDMVEQASSGTFYFDTAEETEIEWVLWLDSGQINDGDAIQLRVIEDGGGTLNTYTQYPDLTAVVIVANLMLSFHW